MTSASNRTRTRRLRDLAQSRREAGEKWPCDHTVTPVSVVDTTAS